MQYREAIRAAVSNKTARMYPSSSDSRSRAQTVFPIHRPKFSLKFTPNESIFTIGSCFARNIEEALALKGVKLPTANFKAPKDEWPGRANGLINEYNPGTISQRIIFALQNKDFPSETIVRNGDSFCDLLLPGGGDVSFDRAQERREQIKNIYRDLPGSQAAIITLGFVEAWYDCETELFLNRMPPQEVGSRNPSRFILKRLDIDESMRLLGSAIEQLSARNVKIILTVSPVPLGTTFMKADCVVANEFSKSVLRVCADRLSGIELVDYFPSYEIVRGRGMSGFIDDQIHVKQEVVDEIVKYMFSIYDHEVE